MLYARLADLPLEIESYRLEPLALATGAGWTRHTTVVRLSGAGAEGLGEDVCYDEPDHVALRASGTDFPLAGRTTLDGFSRVLDAIELFPAHPPSRPEYRLYRRWAFESAALDLALRQNGLSLAKALERKPRPVSYVVSLGLGEPPGTARLERVRERYPETRFKVDLAESWTRETVAALAQLGGIDCVDLKGHYHGSYTGPKPDPEQYRWIAEHLPEALIEDPAWNKQTRKVLAPHRERITWDAPLHSLADVEQLPFPPRTINVKPSRFGFLSELLRVYEYCEAGGIAMYGGGQFEIGPGRAQIQALASLFHPDAANDVAPTGFNRDEVAADLPVSPLRPPLGEQPGFVA